MKVASRDIAGSDLMRGGSASSFSKAKLYGAPTDQQSTAAHDSVRAVTSAGYIDARIDDDELEMEFRNSATLASQAGRHRIGAIVSFLMLIGITVLTGKGGFSNMVHRFTFLWWFVAEVALVHTVFVFAKRASLDDYRRRFAWACLAAYLGCFFATVAILDAEYVMAWLMAWNKTRISGRPGELPQGSDLELLELATRALRLWLIGWNSFSLNIFMSICFCYCDLSRVQAVVCIISLVHGVVASALASPAFGATNLMFILLHTLCCLGCIVGFTHYNVIARRSFLYTKMLVAEVISERELNAEAKAIGEQAICAWVCHEIRNPLNALQFWYVSTWLAACCVVCRLFC
jgi:hypothetical protein